MSRARVRRKLSRSLPLPRHEPVGFCEGASCPGGAFADRLDNQAGNSRFAPHSFAPRLARHSLRISRKRRDRPAHVGTHRKKDRSYSTRFIMQRDGANGSRNPMLFCPSEQILSFRSQKKSSKINLHLPAFESLSCEKTNQIPWLIQLPTHHPPPIQKAAQIARPARCQAPRAAHTGTVTKTVIVTQDMTHVRIR